MSQCQARAEFFSVSIVKSAIFRTLPLWFCKAPLSALETVVKFVSI